MTDQPHNTSQRLDEPDNMPAVRLFLALLLLTIFIVVTVFVLDQWTNRRGHQELQTKQASVVDPRLGETRAREEGILTTYDVANAEKGYYRVPVASVLEKMAGHPETLAPLAAPLTE